MGSTSKELPPIPSLARLSSAPTPVPQLPTEVWDQIGDVLDDYDTDSCWGTIKNRRAVDNLATALGNLQVQFPKLTREAFWEVAMARKAWPSSVANFIVPVRRNDGSVDRGRTLQKAYAMLCTMWTAWNHGAQQAPTCAPPSQEMCERWVPNLEETLNSNATSVNPMAFHCCRALDLDTLPSTIISVGTSAFENCTSLRLEGWTGDASRGCEVISASAFKGCSALKLPVLPSGVCSIGDEAFMDCSALPIDRLPKLAFAAINLTIGTRAFANCSSITVSTVPVNVTSIRQECFSGCTSISTFTLPNAVKRMMRNAFFGCTALVEVQMGDAKSITILHEQTFAKCNRLRVITLPPVLESIKEECFDGCTSLESLKLPETLKSIDAFAFRDCANMKLDGGIPKPTTIAENAFRGVNAIDDTNNYARLRRHRNTGGGSS